MAHRAASAQYAPGATAGAPLPATSLPSFAATERPHPGHADHQTGGDCSASAADTPCGNAEGGHRSGLPYPFPFPIRFPTGRDQPGRPPQAPQMSGPALAAAVTPPLCSTLGVPRPVGSAMNPPLYFAGLDVGGTTMKAGVVDDNGKPLAAAVSLPTEPHLGQEVGLERMAEAIRQAVAAAGLGLNQVAAIGVATPGTMEIPAGMILDPPNLKPWRNVPVRQYIQDAFRLPTAFQNDANAAAYGEFWAGAGRDAHSMVLFTLGTGVGGGVVIGDLVLEGEHSHGAELGHMKIEMTNP